MLRVYFFEIIRYDNKVYEMKKLEIKKSCGNCIKQSACKYLDAYTGFTESKVFSSLFEYEEWNNLVVLFKENANRCSHYHPVFENGPLKLQKVGYEIFSKAVCLHVGNNLVSTSCTNEPGDYIIATKTGSRVTVQEIEALFTIEIT
jgi:hypothetical protein